MKKNMNQWSKEVIDSKERRAFPLMIYPALEINGMSLLDMLKDPQKQYESLNTLASRYSSAACITAMDLSAEAEAFGSEVVFKEEEIPTVMGKIVDNMTSAEALKTPVVGKARTGIYLEAARLTSEGITDRPVFGCHIGPVSLAGRLCDITTMFMNMRRDPKFIHLVLEKCTGFLIEYSLAFKAAGTNGIVIAEPVAGLLSPSQCDEFSSKYVKRIVDAVQDDNFMVVVHNCGNTVKQVQSMLSTGAKGFHFGNAVKMTDILPQIPENIIAMGNIEPSGVFKMGTPEMVKEKTRELLDATSEYRNFIISSGCDIPPQTPISNINAFFEALNDYNNRN
ncbi:MAG: uroporphyrinogen decarboxylase family protein [Deltaproteobacteria bacterium]|nr:uroporphyrinogen decarboxylase family protein [Deltaproteobacteria bacterium]